MKTYKRSISLILCFVLLITTLFSQSIFTASAAVGENIFGDKLGTTTGSGAGIGRADTFSEDWEGGLDLDKWEVAKYKTSYISDFQVVEDPVEGSNQGNVMKVGYAGTWLVPTDEYWPTGQRIADLATLEFKLYIDGFDSPMGGSYGFNQSNYYGPRIMVYGALGDYKEGVRTMLGTSSMTFFNSFVTSTGTVDGLWSNYIKHDLVLKIGTFHTLSVPSSYCAGFVSDNWMTVKMNFISGNTTVTDVNGKVYSLGTPGTYYKSNKRLTIGVGFENISSELSTRNYKLSDQQRSKELYFDDFKVTFREADYDSDEAVSDVDVYYEGNVFLKPDETIALTGERLGDSVLSAEIARLSDDAVTLENANYVPETHYDAYYAVDAYDMWENKINKDTDTVMSSTEEDGEFKIMSRGKESVNMVIPPSYDEGMYALLLHPSDTSGSSELVIINNPRITLIMGDDGDYATSNGHIEIGGENLSVRDDISKVSAIILDENGNKLHLIQNTADKEYIYVDTTENNGTPNEHYMKISLEGLNLPKGNYQLMVHNGYGGDYGWSMPYSFKVEAKAARQVWRDKGVFNVKDYGAVGDGTTNDTAAVQRAINAAVENGGGIVYFPTHSNGAAHYRITKGLILKENIAIVGDGVGYSTLMFDGYMKTTVDQTRYFISYEKNLEICDIELQSAANYFERVIYKQGKTSGEKGKLYIHDAKLDISADSWRSNRYNGEVPAINGVSSSTAYNAQWANTDKYLVGSIKDTYFEWDNVKTHYSGFGDLASITADYVSFSNYSYNSYGPSATKAGFWHDCSGNEIRTNTVYRNIKEINYDNNNGELFIRDGGGEGGSYTSVWDVDPNSYKTEMASLLSVLSSDERTQLEALVKENEAGTVFNIGVGVSVGNKIKVIGGETGLGQIRTVTAVKTWSGKRFIVIDSPFAVTPNRNSVIATVSGGIEHTYINNGEFENGSLIGVYGLATDYVFSNCTATEVSAAFLCAPNYNSRQWYVTFNNCTINNSSFVNNDIAQKGSTFMTSGGGGSYCGWLGLRYSNNTIYGYSRIGVSSGDTSTAVPHDSLLVEDIEIFTTSPVVSTTGNRYNVYFRNIHQYTDAENKELSEVPWWQSLSTLRNGITNGNIWAELPTNFSQLGDVNGDSFISLPDLDAMRSYFVGKSSITTSRANLTGGDNIVDARDFLYLRAMILYKNDEEKLAEVKAAIDAITASEGGTYEEGNITIDYDGYSDDED